MTSKITLFLLIIASFGCQVVAQTIWTGSKINFTKANNADWTMPENQDRITSLIWITRKNNQGIFNIFSESGYASNVSPADTEWALGTTANLGTLTFDDWETITKPTENAHLELPGKEYVLHLISEDIYIDLKYFTWTSGNAGGGFSYERTTDQALGINDEVKLNSFNVYPNPSSDYLFINAIEIGQKVTLFDILGKKILTVRVSDSRSIDIRKLEKGIYFLRTDKNAVARFIKK